MNVIPGSSRSIALRLRAGLAILLAVTLALAGCGEASVDDSGNRAPERGTPVAAAEIQPRDLSRELSVSATVEAKTHIRLASRASGTVERVEYEVGDRVAGGALMAQLDLSEQRAELSRARAQEEEAELDYARTSELRAGQSISAAEYERSRVALAVARSERLLWETRLGFGRIVAPRNAVVSARYVEPGEAVQAQDTLFELTVLDSLVVRPGSSELDVVHLEAGQVVPVRLDAMPETEFEAIIRRIYPTADGGSRLVTVEIELPNDASDRGVRPGYLARIRLPIDTRTDALAVPSAAIGDDGDRRYVYVIADDRLERREVEPGVSRGQWTEIRSGLAIGDIVLATNPIDMRDGEAVRIVGWRG